MEHTMAQRLTAEFLGTFVLVFGGCGTAVLAAGVPDVSVGYLGVAFAFGLSVMVMAYAVGHISGGHFNPAITLGMAASGRFSWRDVLPYIVAQVLAAIAAAALLDVLEQPLGELRLDFERAMGVGKAGRGTLDHRLIGTARHRLQRERLLTEVGQRRSIL